MADIPHAEAARQASFHWNPDPPPQPAGWMDLKDVCTHMKLPPDTVKQYVAEGILPAYKPGTSRQLRFRREDVDQIFQRVEPTYRESRRQERLNGKEVHVTEPAPPVEDVAPVKDQSLTKVGR
jgi:excisionase family DNA binding protein